MGFTIISGVIQSLSVSQIASANTGEYGGCLRSWYLERVEGVKKPSFAYQEVGSKVHSQNEHYLKTGEDVLGAVAAAGRHLLPLPGADLLVEWGFNDKAKPEDKHYFPPEESLLRAEGIPLIGFIDLAHSRGAYVDETGKVLADPEGTVEAHDHKTTSNLDYAKSGKDLVDTTQMIGYGEWLTIRFPWAKFVRLTHLYLLTHGMPMARKSTVLVAVDEIHARWRRQVLPVVRQMKDVARLKRVEDVPMCPDAGEPGSACRAFGRGCPYQSICFNAMSRIKMGLLSSRKSTSSSAPTDGAAAIPLPPPPGGGKPAADSGGIPASKALQGQPYTLGDGTVAIFICGTNGKQSFSPTTGGAPILLAPATIITPGVAKKKPEPIDDRVPPPRSAVKETVAAAMSEDTGKKTVPKKGADAEFRKTFAASMVPNIFTVMVAANPDVEDDTIIDAAIEFTDKFIAKLSK